MLQECLTFSEIGDYLRCSPDPSCKVNLLGLTEERIHNQNPHRKVKLVTLMLFFVVHAGEKIANILEKNLVM